MRKKTKFSSMALFKFITKGLLWFWTIVLFVIFMEWSKEIKWTLFWILSGILLIFLVFGFINYKKVFKVTKRRFS